MKTRLLSIFFTLFLISSVLRSDTFAEDYTQMNLPEGAIARFGKGGVGDIQYSPDGKLLAVASRIGIWLYDTAIYQEAALFTGNTFGITNTAFSPDGRTCVGSSGGDIYLWDTTEWLRNLTKI